MPDDIHNFYLAQLSCRTALGILNVYEPAWTLKWWFFYLPFYACKWGNHNKSLVGRQMKKVLARPANNAEQLCGQSKGGTFKREHFTKFFAGLHEIFGFHRANLLSFVVCFNVVQLFYFDKILKYLVCVKIFHEAKLQAFAKMQMTRNQANTFQNRRFFRELNNFTLAEQTSKVIRQTLVLTCSSPVESLHNLFAVAVGLLQPLLALVTIKLYP